ncbi:PREDICTED: dyslexia-associated protein KIAA0319-like protein [Papilio xuthus]|uniref:Dyslexia-associated protein KIAA0319-like protein n=1 Tax=Papilio xuthus TaxID=66420 RepID=A0AAJ7EJH2_PAPXU|nr:PREDICTED: dyslexia-associated protein KIAA0319-like protein [Papilio xuthus]
MCVTNTVQLLAIFIIANIRISSSQFNKHWNDKYENMCPKLYPKYFDNYAPAGNLTAGNFSEKKELKGVKQCVMSCCLADSCNIAFIVDSKCYHIECVSDELCLPLTRTGPHKWDSHVAMILVKPVLPNENWLEILDQSNNREVTNNFSQEDEVYPPFTGRYTDLLTEDEDFLSRFLNNLPNNEDEGTQTFSKFRENSDNEMIMDASNFLEKVPCVVGVPDDCPFNSECVSLGLKLRNGICKCIAGTEENAQGACIQSTRPYSKAETIPIDTKKDDDLVAGAKFGDTKSDMPVPRQNLTVSILSKQVQLPDNEVTLAAYTIPDEKATGSHYNYVWTLVDQPKDGFTGNMNQNGPSVTLTDLTEGQYRFKVTVNGTNSYGEGFANVTVLPPKRTNTPPLVVITPQVQTVKLPNSVAVLDGSASKSKYTIHLLKCLQLTNIESGRYVFELTVTDDQGESDRDAVSVQVKPDPLEMNLLEMTLHTPVSAFTKSQLDGLVQKITLLLKDDIKVNVTEIRGEVDSGNTQIIFFLSEKEVAVEGIRALGLLRGSGVGASAGVARVRSLRCLSTCSGRGVCDRATRTCRCDAFWMQSLFTQLDPDAMPDCDWSVVYASLGGVGVLCAVGGACGALARLLRRLCAPRKPRPRSHYRLLPRAEEDKPFTSKDMSETETESDVLYESKTKSTLFSSRATNGDVVANGWKKNGVKPSRKVKT